MWHLLTDQKCILSLVSHEASFNRSRLYFILVSHAASGIFQEIMVVFWPWCSMLYISADQDIFQIFNVKRRKYLKLPFTYKLRSALSKILLDLLTILAVKTWV
jgi:hypothetical protein